MKKTRQDPLMISFLPVILYLSLALRRDPFTNSLKVSWIYNRWQNVRSVRGAKLNIKKILDILFVIIV